MANHMKDERSTAGGNPPKPPAREQSREEIRARQAAEKREKQEWIARRMREDQEAAEREAREKAEWIARRMREDEEQEAREKAALAAQRKRQQALTPGQGKNAGNKWNTHHKPFPRNSAYRR